MLLCCAVSVDTERHPGDVLKVKIINPGNQMIYQVAYSLLIMQDNGESFPTNTFAPHKTFLVRMMMLTTPALSNPMLKDKSGDF
jgi:hypothetical protein